MWENLWVRPAAVASLLVSIGCNAASSLPPAEDDTAAGGSGGSGSGGATSASSGGGASAESATASSAGGSSAGGGTGGSTSSTTAASSAGGSAGAGGDTVATSSGGSAGVGGATAVTGGGGSGGSATTSDSSTDSTSSTTGTIDPPPLGAGFSFQFPPRLQKPTALRLAADSQGNMIVSGSGYSPSEFGLDGADTELPFVMRISPSGELQDVVEFPDGILPELLAVGPDDNVWIAGQLFRAASFGGASIGPVDDGYYLVQLTAGLEHVSSIPVPHDLLSFLRAMTTDAAGNVYVATSATSTTPTWTDGTRVEKYTPGVGFQWSMVFPGTDSSGYPNDLAASPSGSVFVAGSFNGSIEFGDTTLTSTAMLDTFSMSNAYVAELDGETGVPLMSQRFGGVIFDLFNSVDVTPTGQVRVAGTMSGNVDFGGTLLASDQEGSAMVAELEALDDPNWAVSLGGDSHIFNAATGPNSVTYAVGRVDAPGGEFMTEAVSSFLAVLSPEGTPSVFTYATGDSNGAGEVALDALGGIWVAGEFSGATDFGFGEHSVTGHASFLVRFLPREP